MRGIHAEANVAAQLTEERLKAAQSDHEGVSSQRDAAKTQYDNWVVGYTEENSKEPTVQDR